MKRLLLMLWCASHVLLAADQPATLPADASNGSGFRAIFDGKSLDGWDGNPAYWRVENGCIVGEITPATIVKRNTFLIWRGGSPGDFELQVEYRISDRGNSGINYRSVELTDAKWSLSGYQADIDGPLRNKGGLRYTGINYEERGRTFLANRGQIVRLADKEKPAVIGSVGDEIELTRFFHDGDWNEYHLIVRGNTLIHMLNGHVTSIVIDDDTAHRRFDGLIGVQVHVGPPMKVEFRSIRLKTL